MPLIINQNVLKIKNDNGEYINIDAIGKVNKAINNFVTPEEYGAVGDGITNDTAAIQNAINNENNYPILFQNKYLINSVALRDNTKIIFNKGVEIYSIYNASVGDRGCFYCEGSVSDNKTVLDTYSQNRIPYNDAYTTGDYIQLYSYIEDAYINRGIYQIVRATPSYFFLSNHIPFNDATHYSKITPKKNIEIIGDNTLFKNVGENTNFGDFIALKYCIDSKISNITFEGNKGRGITLRTSYHTQVNNCNWSAIGIDVQAAGSPFYEPFIDICGNGTIFQNCTATNCRGGFDFAGSIYSKVKDCYCHNAKIRTHGMGCRYVTFDSCYITGEKSNEGCATFGNHSFLREDAFIYCNNCVFCGGAHGVYVCFGTNNVFLNNCFFSNLNTAIKGSSGTESDIPGDIYLNLCSQENNDYIITQTFNNIIINGTLINNKTDISTANKIIMPL